MSASSTVAVPSTLDQALSPDWLTAALGLRYPGIEVTGVEPGPEVSRVSTNVRFRIECAGGVPEGLSPNLCVKGYFRDPGARSAGVFEAHFYRELAESSGIRTLRCVYADIDAETNHGVVITEDVAVHGATFIDGRSPYTPDQAAESLGELAKLHAATWGDARLAETPWLAPRLTSTVQSRGVPEISYNFDGPIGAGVPEEVRDAQRLVDVYKQLAAEAAVAEPWCVVHGDAHEGNLFVEASGRPSWLDWQLVQRSAWYIDVGYHIASTMAIDDRRKHERDLLKHYLDELRARGVEAPTWDVAWAGMKRGIVHGFFLWGITQRVAPPITTALLTKLGTAAADHDSLSLPPA